MAGVKSTFVIGDELLMTAFGDRNEAIAEKQVDASGTVRNIQDPAAYEAACRQKSIAVASTNNHIKANITDPRVSGRSRSPEEAAYRERLRAHRQERKDAYEQRVFGETFDDNIHIQLIYKILDIEKTFTGVMTNICYALNNLHDRTEDADWQEDIFCDLNDKDKAAKKDRYIEEMLPRAAYVFPHLQFLSYRIPKNEERNDDKKRNEIRAENADKLRKYLDAVRIIRNDTFHGTKRGMPKGKYNLDNENEATQALYRKAFDDKVREVSENYLQNSRVNINFLARIMLGPVPSKKELKKLVENYFAFAILKQYKNLGFSITSLREALLAQCGLNFESKENLRPRVNSFCDYVLFDYYTNRHPEAAKALVERLRAGQPDEKDALYREEAGRLPEIIAKKFLQIDRFDEKCISGGKSEIDVSEIMVKYPYESENFRAEDDSIRKKSDLFCGMAYMLTLFLDGKEINIFLTALQNIFENIASFLDVMNKQDLPCRFEPDYVMFADAAYIAEKLRTAISLARMKKSMDVYNSCAIRDAIAVLGKSREHSEMAESDYIQTYVFDNGEKNGGAVKGKGKDHNLRNFLVSNVIRSRKFNYLARYADLATVKRFAENRSLVRFVLGRIEPSMIGRYYYTIFGKWPNRIPPKEQIDALTDELVRVNVDRYATVNNTEMRRYGTATVESVKERNRMRAGVGLYLTVLYQIVKNLLYINGRYALAFAFLEHDAIMEKLSSAGGRFPYDIVTRHYLENGYIKCATEKIRANMQRSGGSMEALNHIPGVYIEKNLAAYCGGSETVFRNSVAHLIMMARTPEYAIDIKKVDSYFALYHYCMQKHILYCAELFERTQETEAMRKALRDVVDHKTYSKDAVKFLCVPFAYNLPRYKALSICALFDWSEYMPEKASNE